MVGQGIACVPFLPASRYVLLNATLNSDLADFRRVPGSPVMQNKNTRAYLVHSTAYRKSAERFEKTRLANGNPSPTHGFVRKAIRSRRISGSIDLQVDASSHIENSCIKPHGTAFSRTRKMKWAQSYSSMRLINASMLQQRHEGSTKRVIFER